MIRAVYPLLVFQCPFDICLVYAIEGLLLFRNTIVFQYRGIAIALPLTDTCLGKQSWLGGILTNQECCLQVRLGFASMKRYLFPNISLSIPLMQKRVFLIEFETWENRPKKKVIPRLQNKHVLQRDLHINNLPTRSSKTATYPALLSHDLTLHRAPHRTLPAHPNNPSRPCKITKQPSPKQNPTTQQRTSKHTPTPPLRPQHR